MKKETKETIVASLLGSASGALFAGALIFVILKVIG